MLTGSLREDASEDFSNIEEHLSHMKGREDRTPVIDVNTVGLSNKNAISIFDLSMLQNSRQMSRTITNTLMAHG